jgi:hypothetical protein
MKRSDGPRCDKDGGVLTLLLPMVAEQNLPITPLLCLRERIDESKGHVVRGRV